MRNREWEEAVGAKPRFQLLPDLPGADVGDVGEMQKLSQRKKEDGTDDWTYRRMAVNPPST